MILHLLVFAAVPLLCTEAKSKSSTCPIRPYTAIDLNKVNGTWYAVRGIEHNRVKHTSRQRNSKACPVITIKVRDSTHLEFSYDSKNGSEPRQYNVTVRDPAVPSVWTTEKGNKKQIPFDKLQVNYMADHSMALTMCGTHHLATVVLFREKKFSASTVNDITQRLAAKGLNSTRTFDRCKT